MKNYKLTCVYDGSRYKGWQRLGDDSKTIQETLESAIKKVLEYKVEIHGSGRTDAGVHANGQVFHMKLPFLLEDDFCFRINSELPEDIRIVNVVPAKGGFHARYDAVEKVYSYRVDTSEKPSVFRYKYEYHFPFKLDVEKMRKAAKYLVGTHDFSAFTDDKSEGKDKERTLFDITIVNQDGRFQFVYRGDGFLQHMVRIMTGTLLEVGRGDSELEDLPRILKGKCRAEAGFLVPAKGLFLEEVKY